MTLRKKINRVNILLAIVATIMIALGIINKILPPALTGIGFLLIIWALNTVKNHLR